MEHNKLIIKKSTPWVEKYRPEQFDNIVLEENNKKILLNMIEKNRFSNLLFYGPPGTGKTTTIINLIKEYQKKYNQDHKELMIHLNASDERGIDIIRNNLFSFTTSGGLFHKGVKFVILDEVDYMTKNAHQALKYLMQINTNKIIFCLICNYVSRIDISLQNECIRICFNKLPDKKIMEFLKNIVQKEKLNITNEQLNSIKNLYNSDLRSMINHLQLYSNENIDNTFINDKQYIFFSKNIKSINNINEQYHFFENFIRQYNVERKDFIYGYISYIIKNKIVELNDNFFKKITLFLHYDEEISPSLIKLWLEDLNSFKIKELNNGGEQ